MKGVYKQKDALEGSRSGSKNISKMADHHENDHEKFDVVP